MWITVGVYKGTIGVRLLLLNYNMWVNTIAGNVIGKEWENLVLTEGQLEALVPEIKAVAFTPTFTHFLPNRCLLSLYCLAFFSSFCEPQRCKSACPTRAMGRTLSSWDAHARPH